MKKFFTLLFLMINSFVFAQITVEEAIKPLQAGEVVVDNLKCTVEWYMDRSYSQRDAVEIFNNHIKRQYPNNKRIKIRNLVFTPNDPYLDATVDVVELSLKAVINNCLNKAFDKVLMNVREGSRFSIDKVTVTGEIANEVNKEIVTDNTIDILLDKGYKVVAKEYLERLYQEQQTQQSGIYNENTVVQENNLSAVGYFLNIKITDESLRVQVINVSTGEYEGNATITF